MLDQGRPVSEKVVFCVYGLDVKVIIILKNADVIACDEWAAFTDWEQLPVSYTHLTLPTNTVTCRSRWSPYH